MFSEEPTLELFLGPMFAGKTTRLIERYNEKCEEVGKEKCLAINYALDKRYSLESEIVSHDQLKIECYSILDLAEFVKTTETQAKILEAEYIFINEAQFFKDLLQLTLFLKNVLKKNLVLCGLDLDFKRNKFGELVDLTDHATSVHYLTGRCNTRNCLNPSLYSHRKTNSVEQVLIGTSEYEPLCGECYDKANSFIEQKVCEQSNP